MKPYFQEGNITIYHGDCLEVMKNIDFPKRSLLFTDPPYGIKESAGKNKSRGMFTTIGSKRKSLAKSQDFGNKDWDDQIPPKEYFEFVLNHTSDQILFGGNYFLDHLPSTSCFLIWDKDNHGTDFADCEIAWTSFKSAIRLFKFRWNGMLQQDMKNKEIRIHPTQKPSHLAKQILQRYYDPDKYDTVIDSYMGSGSFGLASKILNIPYIGIEQDEEYIKGAINRLASVKYLINNTTPQKKKGLLY